MVLHLPLKAGSKHFAIVRIPCGHHLMRCTQVIWLRPQGTTCSLCLAWFFPPKSRILLDEENEEWGQCDLKSNSKPKKNDQVKCKSYSSCPNPGQPQTYPDPRDSGFSQWDTEQICSSLFPITVLNTVTQSNLGKGWVRLASTFFFFG